MKTPGDDVSDQTHATYRAVLDHLEMAECFLGFAEVGSPDVRRRWCFNIAASAIWSALDIFNKKLLDKSERLSESTSGWFDEQEELVNLLRHGVVHFQQDQGIGISVGPEVNDFQVYIWIDSPLKAVPIGEVVSKLRDVATKIKDMAKSKMGYDIISLS